MAKKKMKKLAAPNPSSKGSSGSGKPKSGGAANVLATITRPRVLSTFAFGLSGLLAGLATGLNHFPTLGQSDAIPRMMLLAAYLGDPHVDWAHGITTGFTGLVVGSCLGFSALSEPKDVLLSILLSVVFAVGAMMATGNVALAGIGFLAGHTPAILAYLKLRNG